MVQVVGYETSAAQLVQMLEARFISLNPVLQQMFLKLNEIERGYERLELDYATPEGEKTLEQVGSGIVLWPKSIILFPDLVLNQPSPSGNPSPPSPPQGDSGDDPHSASSPRSPSPHQPSSPPRQPSHSPR